MRSLDSLVLLEQVVRDRIHVCRDDTRDARDSRFSDFGSREARLRLCTRSCGAPIKYLFPAPNMPPRKELKEQVYYPPSKQKTQPFKPLRPSNLPRASTTDSESTISKRATKPPPPKRRKTTISDDDNEESDAGEGASEEDSDESEDLPENPLTAKPSIKVATKRLTPRRKPARHVSPMSISSEEAANAPSMEPDPPPGPSQSDTIPTIPQPLLVRLLHEHFADKNTKIDKHAMQVLQKYFEVFIRETIARAFERKKQEAEESGGVDAIEASWLELEDLEKVAAAMMLDF